MAEAPATMARTLRKRTFVNYLESEDEVVTETEIAPVPAKKRKTKPLPTKKIFPFLKLPPELRNEIYRLAFGTAKETWLIYVRQNHRRTAIQATIEEATKLMEKNGLSSQLPLRWENSTQPTRIPNLLLANRQIYEEAASMLYGGSFVFLDSKAMYQFLVCIGPTKKRFVERIVLKDYAWSSCSLVHAAFDGLRDLMNLNEVVIDGTCGWGARSMARRLYQNGVHWMEAVGAREGRYDAALDILTFGHETKKAKIPEKEVMKRLRKMLRQG